MLKLGKTVAYVLVRASIVVDVPPIVKARAWDETKKFHRQLHVLVP